MIIIARGGGSLEDLWCFNDEKVARAVAASRVPVISGIGHEIDFTIVDFVADLRAPTPSAAAELATPNRDDLLLDLDRLRAGVTGVVSSGLADRARDLSRLQSALRFVSPAKTVRQAQPGVSELRGRLERAAQSHVGRLRERLANTAKAMERANPRHILSRGYALVRDESGMVIRGAAQVSRNQRLNVQLAVDEINVRVDD